MGKKVLLSREKKSKIDNPKIPDNWKLFILAIILKSAIKSFGKFFALFERFIQDSMDDSSFKLNWGISKHWLLSIFFEQSEPWFDDLLVYYTIYFLVYYTILY
jgi:hypothetical protein